MKRYIPMLIMLICLSATAVMAGTEQMKQGPYMGSKEFEHMKALVGTWEGRATDMGNAEQKVTLQYRMTGGGSAIVETLFPGTPNEMVSVYHDDNGKLTMTHYCMLRNQPRMALTAASEKELMLEFISGSNIDPMKDPHMHALTITFDDSHHITQKWVLFEAGKEKSASTFKFTRVK